MAREGVNAVVVGGPTAVLEYAGLRVILDPTFDPPGGEYTRSGVPLYKTRGPALAADEIGPLDIALVSHDQHDDNLDPAGRALLASVGLTFTTPLGATRIGARSVGMPPWTTVTVGAPDGRPVEIISVPALHGPPGIEAIAGPVTGFVLRAEDRPTVYVSGDNASLDHVREIADRIGPTEVAVLFAGAALPRPELGTLFTINSAEAATAAAILGARAVLPVHYDGWRHFSEGADRLREAFAEAGLTDLLVLPEFGTVVTGLGS